MLKHESDFSLSRCQLCLNAAQRCRLRVLPSETTDPAKSPTPERNVPTSRDRARVDIVNSGHIEPNQGKSIQICRIYETLKKRQTESGAAILLTDSCAGLDAILEVLLELRDIHDIVFDRLLAINEELRHRLLGKGLSLSRQIRESDLQTKIWAMDGAGDKRGLSE